MQKNLEDHIMETLESYENDKATDLEYFKENEITCNVVDSQIKLLKLLDDKQVEALRDYIFTVMEYQDALKAEYFSAGFVHGLYKEKNEFEL